MASEQELYEGDTIFIVNTSCMHALGVEQYTNNRAVVSVALYNGRLQSVANVQEVVQFDYNHY